MVLIRQVGKALQSSSGHGNMRETVPIMVVRETGHQEIGPGIHFRGPTTHYATSITVAPPNGSKIIKTLACGEHLKFEDLHVSHTLREEVCGSEEIADYSDSLCFLQ